MFRQVWPMTGPECSIMFLCLCSLLNLKREAMVILTGKLFR